MSARPSAAPVLPLVAAGVTVLLWSSAFVGIRAAAKHLGAGPLCLARLAIGAIALGALVLVRREPMPPRGALTRIAVCGVLWFGIYTVAVAQAERHLDAGTAAMLVNVGPVLIAVLAGFVLGEGFPRTLVIGCAVAFAGAVLIGIATSRHGFDDTWSAVLCLIAALAYAIAVVAQKPLLERSSALTITWLACTIGAVCCLPFAPALWNEVGGAGAGTIAWTVFLGLGPTAVAFTTWAYALRHTSAGRMGATTYFVPPLATAMGAAYFGEVPPALAFGGGALCLLGAGLARRR